MAFKPYDYDSAIRERYAASENLGRDYTNIIAQQAAQAQALREANERNQMANAADAGASRAADLMPMAKGGTGGFGRFMQSISAQESGGSYGARNPMSGAMGKYQIMPANIAGSGGWDKEVLGYNITPAQFMASPQIQEKIASAKLQQYYSAYGPAGAAIAWYAGPGAAQKYVRGGGASSRGEAGGHPSVSGYMQSILRRMGLA